MTATTAALTSERSSPRPELSERSTISNPIPFPVPAVVGQYRLKAVFDFCVASFLLIVTAPITLVALAAVKWTSKGPGIYTQERVGLGGKVFTIYKIRTMVDECESLSGPRWSMPGDPRVTRVGWVLRTLHIDELPQLWNVIRGDMSLIGPRPERPKICEEIRPEVYGYDRRHAVKPGITGFAQIHLPPDSSMASVRNKLSFDRYYIRHQGAWLDLKILFCTGLKLLGMRRWYLIAPTWLRVDDE